MWLQYGLGFYHGPDQALKPAKHIQEELSSPEPVAFLCAILHVPSLSHRGQESGERPHNETHQTRIAYQSTTMGLKLDLGIQLTLSSRVTYIDQTADSPP